MKTMMLLMCGALAAAAQGADDPASELASFQMAEGFEANLFASEKDGVIKPIQIRFDGRGRVWVIGSTVYPQIEPGQTPNDKVLILEDTNGDGRSDRTTVFADGLMIPTGLALGHGGAYVGHGTELLFLKDSNGDDKADERRVVLRGFGTGDNHQNINSFTWGPGSELWMSQGLHTHSRVETPWGIEHLEQAGIWRFRPHLLRLEGFHGFAHEPQNPWGFAFTHWGEPIVIAGNNSSHTYPVPGLVPNRRDEAPPLIWPAGQGRKCSGGDIVGTAHFPEEWQGRLIMGGYINNTVWTVNITDDGSGFRLVDAPPLLRSTSRSFRPVDVKFGPDGAFYVCDWYNPIIGHYQASFRHPDRDKTHGRIWRITAKGRALTKAPKLIDLSPAELLAQLKSPDRWTREFAKRVLADSPRDEVKRALDTFVARAELSEHVLKEALGVYASHEIVEPELLKRLFAARDSGARAYAAHMAGLWADRLSQPLPLLQKLIADQNPRVRLHALVACAHVRAPEAVEVAMIAADQPSDRFIDYALRQVVFSLKPAWQAAFKDGKLKFDGKLSRLSVFVRADGTPDTIGVVRDLVQRPEFDAATRQLFWRLLAEQGNAEDCTAILNMADEETLAQVIPVLGVSAASRRVRVAGDTDVALKRLAGSRNAVVRAHALQLAGQWKIESLRPLVEATALDSRENPELRRAAVIALGAFGGTSNLVSLATAANAEVRSAAIVALAAIDPEAAARSAAELLSSTGGHAEEIFSGLLGRKGGAEALEAALTAMPPSKAAAETGLRVMNAGGKRDESLSRLLARAAGLEQKTHRFSDAEKRAFVTEVESQGVAARGAGIFRKPEIGCVACHAVNGQGGNSGPDLSALGSAQPIDFILGAIIDPQKEIKEGYTSVSITTRDGDEHQGYLLREERGEIVLRDVLQNKEVRLRRDTVKEKRANGSVMPEGLADTLTRAELRDLVRYLSELGTVK